MSTFEMTGQPFSRNGTVYYTGMTVLSVEHTVVLQVGSIVELRGGSEDTPYLALVTGLSRRAQLDVPLLHLRWFLFPQETKDSEGAKRTSSFPDSPCRELFLTDTETTELATCVLNLVSVTMLESKPQMPPVSTPFFCFLQVSVPSHTLVCLRLHDLPDLVVDAAAARGAEEVRAAGAAAATAAAAAAAAVAAATAAAAEESADAVWGAENGDAAPGLEVVAEAAAPVDNPPSEGNGDAAAASAKEVASAAAGVAQQQWATVKFKLLNPQLLLTLEQVVACSSDALASATTDDPELKEVFDHLTRATAGLKRLRHS
jgi:hypothetical protein